jgi:hypothetical protein
VKPPTEVDPLTFEGPTFTHLNAALRIIPVSCSHVENISIESCR